MQTTNNLGLKKPGENDFINVEDLNHNADILDSKVKEALDKTVEVVNELDSNETNKALSAAQGKELKRLIDEVPQVEVVDNLSTQNGQKALSAAQGVVIAEQLKKSGLKVANATYHNNTIAIEDFTPQEDVLFLLNLSSVYQDSMHIDRNTNIAFDSQLLKVTKFNNIEFLETTEIKQRQFICLKKENKVWIEVYSAELDNKIFELQQRVSECFQSARDGKVKLADAITSKGQAISNTASFQEMAESIRESLMSKSEDSLNKVYSNGVYVNHKIVNVKEFYKGASISISKDVNQELYNLLKTRQYGYRFEYPDSSKSSVICDYINRNIDSYNLFYADGSYYVVFAVKYNSTNDINHYTIKTSGLKIRVVFARATIGSSGMVLLSNYKILTEVDSFHERAVASVVVVKENKVFIALPYAINQSQFKVKVFKYAVRNGSIIFEGYNTDRKLSEIVASGIGSQSGSELTETEIEVGDGVIYDLWTEKIRNKRQKAVNIESFEPYTRIRRDRNVRKVEVKTGANAGFYALAYSGSQNDVVEIYRYNESGWVDRESPICTKNFIRGKISASSGYNERVLNKAFVKHYAYIAFPDYHIDMDNIVVYDIRKNQLYHIREFFDSLKLYKTKIYTGYGDQPYSNDIGVGEFVPSTFDEAVVYFQNREWMSSSDDRRRGYLGMGEEATNLLLYRRDDGKSFLSEQYAGYHQQFSFLNVRSHNGKPQYLQSYLNGSIRDTYRHVDESNLRIESRGIGELTITGSTYEIVEDFRK